jgi:alpha-beta hydrolase superfamily lysophospholipase
MRNPSTSLSFALAFAAALATSGCSYPPQAALHLPEQPAASPADVEHKDGTFEGVHQTKLYEQSWRPRGEPRAVVVLVHGLKDHSGRYQALAERLARQGFAVHAFDLRGHGRSEGMRVWTDAFDDYVEDLALFFDHVRESEPGRPALLFGHSMGGAIAALYTLTKKPDLKGLALSGAALDVDVSGAVVGGTKLINALAPNAEVFQLDLKLFSRDAAVVAACAADPLVFQPPAPARTAAELLGAIHRIRERMAEMTAPLLVMHGEADKVTPPQGSKDLVDRAASKDKTLKIYPGAFHDLLHEPEKEQVMADLVKWMSDHAPAAAPPAPAGPPVNPPAPVAPPPGATQPM